jgi:hypothetical protein
MQESLEPIPAGEVVEAGKQFSGAELDEQPVEQPPAR